jgi:hypothetical protein
MIYIIFAWIFWFALCFNVGLFVLRRLFKEDYKKIDYFYNFWFGLFCLILILEFVSLFYPLNDKVLICLIIFNLGLLILNLRELKVDRKTMLRTFFRFVNIKKILLIGSVVLFISLLANLPVVWYDTNFYHLNSVRWIADYGTVKGLANLHFPLGYSNATFILAAIMDNSVYTNSSSHVMNSFLFIVFAVQVILFLFKRQKYHIASLFGLFSLLILSTYLNQLNSLSTDLGLAVFLLLFNFYVIFFDRGDRVLALPLLVLAAITKFSAFVVLALFLVFLAIELRQKVLVRKNIYIFTLSLLFLGGFIIRNIILSGWAFYPLQLFGFNLKWQVPPEQLKTINDGLTAWSRLPGEHYMSSINVGFKDWFIPWFMNNRNNSLMLYSYIFVPLLLIYLFFRSKLKKLFGAVWRVSKIDFLIFANVATLLYSFITAPDLRYMGIYILTVNSLILSVLLANLAKLNRVNSIIVLVFVLLISSNLLKSVSFSGKKINIQKEESAPVKTVEIVYPDQTFNVLVPESGDQCGNSESPCAPHVNGFKMLQPGDIKSGFYPPK